MRIAMVDLLAQTPFYDRYLAEALVPLVDRLTLYTIRFHHEPDYFSEMPFEVSPGLTDRLSMACAGLGPLRKVAKMLEHQANWRHMVQRFRLDAPDLVHIQRLPLWTSARWLSEKKSVAELRAMDIPVIYTAHNYVPHDSSPSLRSAYRELYAGVDHLIVHTHIDRARLVSQFGVEESRITVIPQGPVFFDQRDSNRASARRSLGLASDALVFLMLGVIRPYKGIDEVLQAFARIVPQYPEARLLVVGNVLDRQYMGHLKSQVAALMLEPYVVWRLGYIPSTQVGAVHAAADVVVFPYRDISQSAAFLTAAGLGKCTLTTQVGGLAEIVQDGISGVQVASSDPTLVEEGLWRCIALSEEERQRMGETLRLYVEQNCDWLDIARQTAVVYDTLLRG